MFSTRYIFKNISFNLRHKRTECVHGKETKNKPIENNAIKGIQREKKEKQMMIYFERQQVSHMLYATQKHTRTLTLINTTK